MMDSYISEPFFLVVHYSHSVTEVTALAYQAVIKWLLLLIVAIFVVFLLLFSLFLMKLSVVDFFLPFLKYSIS